MNLTNQVPFYINPHDPKNKIKYIADFVIQKNNNKGKIILIDAKTKATTTTLFLLKSKILLHNNKNMVMYVGDSINNCIKFVKEELELYDI